MVFSLTTEWANPYFAKRLRSDVWDSASGDDRTKALTMATNMILSSFQFTDEAFFKDENDLDDCVEPIKMAIAEQALWLLKVDPTNYPELLTLGLASGSVGSVSATFRRDFIAPLICAVAKQLIGDYGTFNDYDSTEGRGISLPLTF